MDEREQADEVARLRADALARLVEERLPLELDVTGDAAAWPLIATGLLSRATTTLRHVFDARRGGQEVDAATLGRSLYEHIVHLAWLAACPTADRIEEWRKHDLTERLSADSDARTVGGQLLDDEAREALEAQVDAMRGNKLVLANLAIAADQHWGGKLPGMGSHKETQSFRGLYVYLYRFYSGTAHPGFRGLNPVVEDITATRRRVVVERLVPSARRGPFGMATVVYALGLYVAAESLGWPEAEEVNAIFHRYPAT